MSDRAARIARVHAALTAAGAVFEPRQLTENTATSVMAAEALGCGVAQIAKTVVFRARADDAAVVAVLCGDDRVDTKKLAAVAGGALGKADAEFVKRQCAFEIGGVAPLGFLQPLAVYLDCRLQRFEKIWAAAGSAHAVFGIAPAALATACGGRFAEFAAAPPTD